MYSFCSSKEQYQRGCKRTIHLKGFLGCQHGSPISSLIRTDDMLLQQIQQTSAWSTNWDTIVAPDEVNTPTTTEEVGRLPEGGGALRWTWTGDWSEFVLGPELGKNPSRPMRCRSDNVAAGLPWSGTFWHEELTVKRRKPTS